MVHTHIALACLPLGQVNATNHNCIAKGADVHVAFRSRDFTSPHSALDFKAIRTIRKTT